MIARDQFPSVVDVQSIQSCRQLSFESHRLSIESQISHLGISDMEDVFSGHMRHKKKKKHRENRVSPMKNNNAIETAVVQMASKGKVVTAEINPVKPEGRVERPERKTSRSKERKRARAAERAAKRASEKRASEMRATEMTGSVVSEWEGSRASERTWSRASERTGSRASERTNSRASDMTWSRAFEKTGSLASERTGSLASERTGSLASERTGSLASERTGSLASEKAPSRTSEMGSGNVFSEATGSRAAVNCTSDRVKTRPYNPPTIDLRSSYRRGSVTSVPSSPVSTVRSGVTTSGMSSLTTSAAPSVTVSLDVSSDEDSSLEKIILPDDRVDRADGGSRPSTSRLARLSAADLNTTYTPSFFGNNNFLVSGNFLQSSDSEDDVKSKKRWPLSLLNKRKKKSDQVMAIELDQTQETSA